VLFLFGGKFRRWDNAAASPRKRGPKKNSPHDLKRMFFVFQLLSKPGTNNGTDATPEQGGSLWQIFNRAILKQWVQFKE
jgi:hypothetical protein